MSEQIREVCQQWAEDVIERLDPNGVGFSVDDLAIEAAALLQATYAKHDGEGMTDQEAFEDYITSQWEWPAAAEKDSKGDYRLADTAVSWERWQAACEWRDVREGKER